MYNNIIFLSLSPSITRTGLYISFPRLRKLVRSIVIEQYRKRAWKIKSSFLHLAYVSILEYDRLMNAQDCSYHDDARSLQVYYSRSIIILAATQMHYESREGTRRRRIPQDPRKLSLAEDSRGQWHDFSVTVSNTHLNMASTFNLFLFVSIALWQTYTVVIIC